MAFTKVNVGSAPNDHTGDPLRTAFQVVNTNLIGTPVGSNMFHVANYAGVTKEARVQATINAAAPTSGVVFVDAANLPYDASLVTFNTAVHMIREGGNPTLGEWDVKAYGAAGNNSQDDYYGCQAAADAASAFTAIGASVGGGKIFCPAGTYLLSRPIIITGNGVGISGPGRTDTQGMATFTSNFHAGHMLVFANTANTIPTVTDGDGTGLLFDGTKTFWFQLRDAPGLDVNGSSGFCAEGHFKPSALTSNRNFIASNGRLLIGDQGPSAGPFRGFQVFHSGTTLWGYMQIGSTFKQLNGGTLVIGTRHHWALTYDGTTVRLFLDGVLVASAVQAGTIQQDWSEDVTIGQSFSVGPEQSADTGQPLGTMYPVRVSNAARYTSGFTPATTLTNDANTVLLTQYDLLAGPCMRAKSVSGDIWLTMRWTAAAGVSEQTISDLRFVGNNSASAMIFLVNSYRKRIARIRTATCRGGICDLVGNGYFNHYEDLWLEGPNGSTPGRIGLTIGSGKGITQIDTMQTFGNFTFPLWCAGDAQVNNAFFQSQAKTILPVVFTNQNALGTSILNKCAVNTEIAVGTDWRGSVAISGEINLDAKLIIVGGVYETANNKPVALVDHAQLALVKPIFSKIGSPTTWCSLLRQPTLQPAIDVDGASPRGGWLPWSDVAGSAVVSALGKGTAITFSATPTFDCSLRDDFEIASVTANITGLTVTNVTPGQEITWWMKQDGTGGRTLNTPANVKGMTAIDAGANKWSQWAFKVGLDLNLYQTGFTSGV